MLWHVVQFYVTGQVVRDVLQARGIAYDPYMYSTGLFDRAWGQYRQAVEQHWRPYVDGEVTLEAAIDGTVKALAAANATEGWEPGADATEGSRNRRRHPRADDRET